MTGARHRLTGRLTVALPPGEAFHLFTAQGERRWAPRWEPSFPAPAADDAEPGTVFQTPDHDHGRTTTWIVVDAAPGRRIRYARVTPGVSAGTVSVVLDEARPQQGDRQLRTHRALQRRSRPPSPFRQRILRIPGRLAGRHSQGPARRLPRPGRLTGDRRSGRALVPLRRQREPVRGDRSSTG
ncbi:hypothetical protein ACFQY7_31315 [Actinomadura luteofluorescens]|uniref:hypothetical protein n=1 Tax=Actinomadura luteofluorescens TaxID=46163 RepID=UPI00363A9D40